MVAATAKGLRSKKSMLPSRDAIRRMTCQIRRGWTPAERTFRQEQALTSQWELVRSIADAQ